MRRPWIIPLIAALSASGADAPSPTPQPGSDDLYSVGQALFDAYAPPEVKEEYRFPTKEEWDSFADKLQRALDNNSLEDLAGYEPQARAALGAAKSIPGYEDYAGWLGLKIDDMEVARQEVARRRGPTGVPRASATPPSDIPLFDLWLGREQKRAVPAGAAALMPVLRGAFQSRGVTPDLAWLAEAESSLNPRASSPAGARGLFQLMPATAKALGLSTFLPDERTEPESAARASAGYLRALYGKFGSWPLALAAYNAGEGRVRRALAERHASDFSGIASSLPTETQMYVPKVCALVDVRTGVAPADLPPPGA
jgi:membrane-bound lytic murein transglycosylase D